MKMVAGTWCLRRSFHFERLACSKAICAASPKEKRRDDEVLITGPGLRLTAVLDQVSTLEERSLLSFQRPVPCLYDGVKKTSDSRQEASEGANRSLYESGLEAPMVE